MLKLLAIKRSQVLFTWLLACVTLVVKSLILIQFLSQDSMPLVKAADVNVLVNVVLLLG